MVALDGTNGALAAIAWLVAGALAVGVGGAAFAVAAHRRTRAAEERLRKLEQAIGDFCGALRTRVALERRCRWPAGERAGEGTADVEGATQSGRSGQRGGTSFVASSSSASPSSSSPRASRSARSGEQQSPSA